ncbi:MAG: hypothetical protein AB7P04_05495 [Bacteriovoracia bacterium]
MKFLLPALFCAVLGLAPTRSEARDMHGRLGLGYNSQFSNSLVDGGVPGISLKYGLTRDIAAALIVGGKTSNPLNSVTAIKFFKNLFFETNLNFYFMLAGGIVSAGSGASAEFLGGMGAEFFIPGVESLGFSVETGVSFSNATGSFQLKTIGVSFLHAGIHFYF